MRVQERTGCEKNKNTTILLSNFSGLHTANKLWLTRVGQQLVCVNDTTSWKKVGEKVGETSSICLQQFANMLMYRSRTPILIFQHKLVNIFLSCEGRLIAII